MAGFMDRFQKKTAVDQSGGETIVLPCKIGDTVWAIRNYHGVKHPQQGVVTDMFFLSNMELQIVVKFVARGKWGENIFATKEDAEKAIGGNKN